MGISLEIVLKSQRKEGQMEVHLSSNLTCTLSVRLAVAGIRAVAADEEKKNRGSEGSDEQRNGPLRAK